MAAADDFYLKHGYGGHFGGRTLIQAHGKIGGHRSVFINLASGNKDAFVYPPFGGVITNPFKGRAKTYAGDLCEYDPDTYGENGGQTVKILKYYELAKATTTTDTDILVVNDGYHHIPFAGDNIMVAQSDFTKKSLGVTITAVEKATEGGKDVWRLTLSATLAVALKVGNILVEAENVGATVAPMVTNPNAYFDRDNDFFYDPNLSANVEDGEGAQYFYTPALIKDSRVILNLAKCNKLPPAVLAMNTRTEKGWFGF